MSENAAAQPDTAPQVSASPHPDEAELEALRFWMIERADHFDPAMLAGMTRGAAGCPFAVEHGDNVTMTRAVFLKLVKSASQPQMPPDNHFTREP
jgi:hypothetical protein